MIDFFELYCYWEISSICSDFVSISHAHDYNRYSFQPIQNIWQYILYVKSSEADLNRAGSLELRLMNMLFRNTQKKVEP